MKSPLKRKGISKSENFFNQLICYASLNLMTNPLQEGENDEIIKMVRL
jgi:hypothetical protein